MTKSNRPVLAIVHGEDSVSPMVLAEHAASICDLVWVVDSNEINDASTIRLLRKLGTTVDIAAMSDDESADALRQCQPDGIIAYADPLIATASALAGRLGLEYHDSATVERLTDKPTQRQALRDGGLPVPRFLVVPPSPTPDDVDAVVAGMDFPVVLKPRRGTASRDTVLVRDASQLRMLLADQGTSPEPSTVVEEYLHGASQPPSPNFADYVTVESIVAAGQISHLAVAGRFPQAEPFRESGFFIPSDFSRSDTGDVLDVATTAILTLGIRTGFVNTEIKMTSSGPRVIEVNGRLGGSAPAIMAQAADIDLFEISQRVALGEHIVFNDLVPTDRVGYLFYVQAPQWASRVMSVEGLDRLGALPGVDSIFLNRQPGDNVDWHRGTQDYVFSLLGTTPDHKGVLDLKRFVDEAVTITYA